MVRGVEVAAEFTRWQGTWTALAIAALVLTVPAWFFLVKTSGKWVTILVIFALAACIIGAIPDIKV